MKFSLDSLPLQNGPIRTTFNYSSINDEEDAFDHHEETKGPSISQHIKGWVSSGYWYFYPLYSEYQLYLTAAILLISTTSERVSFKLMIDRMIPFKFVLMGIIFLISSLSFGLVTLYKILFTDDITPQMKQFPHSKIIIMAILDTLQFSGMVYSGAGVSPTLTVILMHASTLFIFLGSKVAFPQRNYSTLHIQSFLLILLAVLLGLFKVFWSDLHYDNDYYALKSSLVYTISAALCGLSTIYKEVSLVEWSRPCDIYYLSSWLFFYQFLTILILSLLFYSYEDIRGYDSSLFRSSYYGWMCFLGETPSDHNRDDDQIIYVNCSNSMWLIFSYVVSTILSLASTNLVLQNGHQLLSRSILLTILLSFLLLWVYDRYHTQYQPVPFIFGGSVGIFDILSILILLVGVEIYGRDQEPDVEVITNYMTHNPPMPPTEEPEASQENSFTALQKPRF